MSGARAHAGALNLIIVNTLICCRAYPGSAGNVCFSSVIAQTLGPPAKAEHVPERAHPDQGTDASVQRRLMAGVL
jgi:hypothetical protein